MAQEYRDPFDPFLVGRISDIFGAEELVLKRGEERWVTRVRRLLMSDVTFERFLLNLRRLREITSALFTNKMAVLGVAILVFFFAMAFAAPYIAPHYWFDTSSDILILPFVDDRYPLGTDRLGRDVYSQMIYGAQTSLVVGIAASIVASIIGAGVGIVSGYLGGWKDEVLMRANDVILSLPWLILMILLAALIGTLEVFGIIVIIGVTGWSFTARIVRAQVLSVKERMFVERARAIGSSDAHIVWRHVFPNVFPLVFANTILTVSVSILSESTLAFLGFRPINAVSWGTLISDAYANNAFYSGHWPWLILPGLCIVFVVLGFSLLGYALDEILNPKLKRR